MKECKLYIAICVLFVFYNCKFQENKSNDKIAEIDYIQNPDKKQINDTITLSLIEKIQRAPEYSNIGSENVMYDFPKIWSIYDKNPRKIVEKYNFKSLQLSLSSKDSYNLKISKTILLELLSKSTSIEIDLSSIENDSIKTNISYMSIDNRKVYLISFRENTNCNDCEYGSYLAVKFFMTISNKKIIDVLLSSFEQQLSLFSKYQYFFIDEGKINVKTFSREEYDYAFLKYLKYKIVEGKFIKE